MGLFSTLLAACARSTGVWSSASSEVHTFDGLVRMSVPKGLRNEADRNEATVDYRAYHFSKVNDTHINGTTSYSESMSVVFFAPDLPRDRMDALVSSAKPALNDLWWGPTPGLGTDDGHGRFWLSDQKTYERHPVTEPSWYVRVYDRSAGVLIGWRGFSKTYTLEQAKANLETFRNAISVTGNLSADFASRRTWPVSGWEAPYQQNLATVRQVLGELSLPIGDAGKIARRGAWRLAVDQERPQQLQLVYFIAALQLPDGPFRTTERVTYFRVQQGRWRQWSQHHESGTLPESLEAQLATEFADRDKVYFYRIRSVDLWQAHADQRAFAASIRAMIKTTETECARWLKDGFIAGDAEP